MRVSNAVGRLASSPRVPSALSRAVIVWSVAAFTSGCGEDEGASDVADSTPLSDTTDVDTSDLPDTLDTVDTTDAADTADTTSPLDTDDVSDTRDTEDDVDTDNDADTAEPSDVPDADDTGDTETDTTSACGPDTYRDGDDCVPLTVCAPGTRVLIEPTATSDRTCRACPPYMRCEGGTTPGEICRYREPNEDPTKGCAPTRVLAALSPFPIGVSRPAIEFADGRRVSYDRNSNALVQAMTDVASLRVGPSSSGIDACAAANTGTTIACRDSGPLLSALPPGFFSIGKDSLGLAICAIKNDRSISCSNTLLCNDPRPLCTIPADLPPAERIAVGDNVACVLDTTGAVRCWGSNAPSFEGNAWVDVQASSIGVCAIDAADTALCRTVYGDRTLQNVARVVWYKLAMGILHHDGTMTWIPTRPNVPGLPADNSGEVLDLAGNEAALCWLDPSRQFACFDFDFGSWRTIPFQEARLIAVGQGFLNAVGDLGDLIGVGFNVTGEASPPVIAEADGPIVRLVSGTQRTCAITTTGALHCWGVITPPPAELGPVSGVALGNWSFCALQTDGALRCWGDPINTSQLGPVTALDGLGTAMCFALRDGGVRCLGMAQPPESEAQFGTATAVGVGFEHACALTTDGVVKCWGSNSQGQSTVPADLGPADAIAVGALHTCARRTDQTLVCWGVNGGAAAQVPADLGPVQSFDAGVNTTCAIDTLGEGLCWGFPIDLGSSSLKLTFR